MATWNSRGLRGSSLEEIINFSNTRYRECSMALVQKVPTPIKPINIDNSTRHITLAYFEQKSTVDYIGAVQGFPICFDAKECATETFAIANIHEHQFSFMDDFEKQGGLAFILLHFTTSDKIYFVSFKKLKEFYQRAKNGGRKSFRIEELEERYIVKSGSGIPIHYLEGINTYLNDLET